MTGTSGGSWPGLLIIGTTTSGTYSLVGGDNAAFTSLVLTKN